MDEEKYIHIKKEYIIIFAAMAVYFVACVFSFEFAFGTFWIASLVAGAFFYKYANAIAVPTAIWLIYSGFLEFAVLGEQFIGVCFLMALLFLISAAVTKLVSKK